MTDKDKKMEPICTAYLSPQVKVVLMSSLNVLCQSGNEPMREADYGDGGFGEE